MEFYKGVFGGTLTLSTFKEAGALVEADETDLIMHAMLIADNGITLMGSDTPAHMGESKGGTNISISLRATTTPSFAATGTNSQAAAKSISHSSQHHGVTSSACSPTNLVSGGWSTSPPKSRNLGSDSILVCCSEMNLIALNESGLLAFLVSLHEVNEVRP